MRVSNMINSLKARAGKALRGSWIAIVKKILGHFLGGSQFSIPIIASGIAKYDISSLMLPV